MKPRLLDLFCGAGGAARGYQNAGFYVVGVDHKPQPRYAGDEFVQDDALAFMDSDVWTLCDFDAIHASPPCQAYTVANNIHQREHPDLLPATRELLEQTGLPWVIENVPGAPMYQGPGNLFEPHRHGVLVCGRHFPELNVKRHRLFEANFPLVGTPPCPKGHPGDWLLIFGHTVLERGTQLDRNTPSGGPRLRRKHTTTERGREAMGIDWMTRDELSEAIPPAYCEFIGKQLLAWLHASERLPADSSPERMSDTSASPGRKRDSRLSRGGPADNGSSARSHPKESVESAPYSPELRRVPDAQD